MSSAASICPECGAPSGRIHAFSCSRYPDVQKSAAQKREQALEAVRRAGEAGHEFRDQPMRAESAALIDLARLLLTPAALDADEWVKGRIRWHRLDGNDELVVEMLSKENSIRSAIGKEPLDV